MCLCVGVVIFVWHMYMVYEYMYTHISEEAIGCPFYHSLLYSLEIWPLIEARGKLMSIRDLLVSTQPPSTALGLWFTCSQAPLLNVGAGDLNSDPHACAASAFTD